MPFSELFRLAKGKAHLSQTKPFVASPALPYEDQKRPDNKLVELIWENGHITMKGQSSRSKKVPCSSDLPSAQDGKASNSKTPKFGTVDSVFHDFELPVESCQMELRRDEDLVPWYSYPNQEPEPEPERESPKPLQNDFSSEFLQDLAAVTANELSSVNDLDLVDKGSGFNQITRNINAISAIGSLGLLQESSLKASSGSLEVNRAKPTEVSPSIQIQHSLPGSGGKADNTSNFVCRSHCDQSSAGDCLDMTLQRHETGQPSCSAGFFNFSHFSRPAAMVQTALQRTKQPVGTVLNSSEGLVKEEGCAATTSCNPPESTVGNLSNLSLQKEGASHNQPKMTPINMIKESLPSKPSNLPLSANQSRAMDRKELAAIDDLPNIGHGGMASKAGADGEKTVDPVVPASSVCSGNSVGRASNDPKRDLKRKCPETGDFEGSGEEVEEESVGVRKAAPARTGAKRSRVAEVHNLSERRRRDRINEKIRALQGLIPNCNKADKASMLDEAIEYLKTLQLQLQMLSMGGGMFMPPVMLPGGMQHMHGPRMSPFSPMAFGMGMGMGYGMNMVDMNGGIMPVAPVQGVHYPVPSAFHGMAAGSSSLQAPGHPGQGLPVPIPGMPFPHMPGGSSLRFPMGANVCGTKGSVDTCHDAGAMRSEEPLQKDESQVAPDRKAPSLVNQVLNEGVVLPAVLDRGHAAKTREAPKTCFWE